MDDLIERARCGDDKAFIILFEWHKQELWQTAMAVLDNGTDAADALQETVLKAWQAIPRFEGRSRLNTWLIRIVLRTSYDILRKRRRESPLAAVHPDQDSFQGGGPQGSYLDESRILHVQRESVDPNERIDVRQAMEKLSEEDRLLLTWFYVNDYPVKHIALNLDVNEGAVCTRLSRARDRFKSLYVCEETERAEVI